MNELDITIIKENVKNYWQDRHKHYEEQLKHYQLLIDNIRKQITLASENGHSYLFIEYEYEKHDDELNIINKPNKFFIDSRDCELQRLYYYLKKEKDFENFTCNFYKNSNHTSIIINWSEKINNGCCCIL